MAQPGPDPPPVEMTTAELEAAIAAIPAKKDALREAFDRLAACSPFPLPFTWGDLDAHLSSLQFSNALRLRQLRVLEAARPASVVSVAAATGDGEKSKDDEDEGGSEEEEVSVDDAEEEEVSVDGAEEEEVVVEEEVVEEEVSGEEEEEEEEEEAGGEEVEEEEAGDEEVEEDAGGEDVEEDANGEEVEEEEDANGEEVEEVEEAEVVEQEVDVDMQDTKGEEEEVANKTSPVQDKEKKGGTEVEEMREAQEEQLAETEKVSPKPDIEVEKEENREVKKVSSSGNNLIAACASMDATRLVELMFNGSGIRQDFIVVMHHAPDAAALVLCVVRGFLHSKKPKTVKVWRNCVGLIRCVPVVTPKLSTHMKEHAKWLAKDWKEMINNPESCGDLGILASWGLLYFLISYNIVSEFDADEIIRLFGTVPRKHQKKNGVELCNGLELVNRITDLIDYLIGNGQQLVAVHLIHAFKLEAKYSPLSLLEGYVEGAKQTALEIFSKELSPNTLNPAILKEVDNLMAAQNIVEHQTTGSSQYSVILAEVKNLLTEYAKKRSQIKASIALTNNTQQQQQTQKPHVTQRKKRQKNRKRKKEEQQHGGQQNNLLGKQERQQTKPLEKHQQQQQNKPQEYQGQQHKLQEKLQQHQRKRLRPCVTKPPTPVIPVSGVLPAVFPNVAQFGPFGHAPYAVMPGVRTYPGIQGEPFASSVRAPPYMGSVNPFQFNQLYRHPSFQLPPR